MKTKTIKLFEFGELKKDIQERVLQYFRNNEEFSFLEENLKECLGESLKRHKIKEIEKIEMRYSLSYFQGDGFSFIGLFEWKKYSIKIELGNLSNLYYHSNTTNIFIENENGEEPKNYEELEREFNKIYQDICKDLEKIGYDLIEKATSEETIKENIEANEYTFRENGEIESL